MMTPPYPNTSDNSQQNLNTIREDALAYVVVAYAGGALLGRVGNPITVHKLVIRCDKQWRMFCGDWEGWEERHLSWLDDLQPSSHAV